MTGYESLTSTLATGTTETKIYFELRVDPQVFNIDLSKLTPHPPSVDNVTNNITKQIVAVKSEPPPLPADAIQQTIQTIDPTGAPVQCTTLQPLEPVQCTTVQPMEPVQPQAVQAIDNQLTLDEKKFDLNKLNQQHSFDNELEKTLAQLQPIAKEFAAFEEDQEKIFQELVPLNDIKPTIDSELHTR